MPTPTPPATDPARSAVGRALTDAGRPVRDCPSCGRQFDAGANYAGGRLGAPRGYCSTLCRDTAGRLRAAVITRHRTTWHDLAERHRLEDAGQLDLTGLPLAEVPAPPPPPTARRTDETEALPLEDLR